MATATADEPKQYPPGAIVPRLPEGVTAEKLGDKKEAKRVADWLDKEYPSPQPESVKMLVAILRGSQLNGGDGWFGPAQSRYGWGWLAERHRLDVKAKAIPKKIFKGSEVLFDSLDRDGDGAITASDLDWSDRNPYVMQLNMVTRMFRRLDYPSGDGKLTREDLDTFFKMAGKGKEAITLEEFRRAMIPRGSGFSPGDEPKVSMLVKGLFGGEIGSMGEGPKLNDKAPDFTLKSADGKESMTLSKLIGKKPVVLVFGNFTCGPFRAIYPEIDAVYQRYKGDANFLMIYVREAHPTDGWVMASNTKMGVAFKQPATYSERVEICNVFRKKLKPTIPVVVDEIADPVNTAYSGVPARCYVIDKKGKVAYKAGRGPFGFKPGEMEQALVMAILEGSQNSAEKSAGR
ncbi:MAG TPA: deiodinase family protein [Gemmata sp.]|nr:deiodinase family protein [Gemmata sp.]